MFCESGRAAYNPAVPDPVLAVLRAPASACVFLTISVVELPLFISSAFAQTTTAAADGGIMGQMASMLPLVLMFVVLYFVMIRPQMKRQKEARALIEALAKGDEVVTAGGLLGKITKLGDSYLTLELSTGVEAQIQRSAVVQVLPKNTIK